MDLRGEFLYGALNLLPPLFTFFGLWDDYCAYAALTYTGLLTTTADVYWYTNHVASSANIH